MKKFIIILLILFPIYVKAEELKEDKLLTEITLIKCETANYAYFNINGEKKFIRLLSYNRTSGYLDNEIDNYVCNVLKKASKIELEYDTADKDKYNRKYAYIYVDGNLLQDMLISKGYGQVSNILDNYKYLDTLCESEANAIQNKLGIWNYENIKEEYCESGITIENKKENKTKENNKNNKNSYNYLKILLIIESAIVLITLTYKIIKK